MYVGNYYYLCIYNRDGTTYNASDDRKLEGGI